MRLFSILRILAYFVLAWMAVSTLGRLHWCLALLITVLAISNLAILWMLRDHRPLLARVCRRKLLRKYVGVVCYLTGDQLPLESEPSAIREVLLRTLKDFQHAEMLAKQIVRGHGEVIGRVLSRIYENQTLRKSRRKRDVSGPLASFLLVGVAGIGKRYLLRVIAKLLYGNSGIEVFDCQRLTAHTLAGSKDQASPLWEIVEQQPHTLLLFERIEKATPDVSQVLGEILSKGVLKQTGTGKMISLEKTTVAFTTAAASSSLERLANQSTGEAFFEQRAIEAIGEETSIDSGLLSAVTDICFCASPTDAVKSEVIALLMQRECRDHQIELSHVDPEILATQVMQIEPAEGFRLAPQRVKKLLRKPLVAATPHRPPSLSLRVQT